MPAYYKHIFYLKTHGLKYEILYFFQKNTKNSLTYRDLLVQIISHINYGVINYLMVRRV